MTNLVELNDDVFAKLDAIIGDKVLNPFKVGSFIFAQFTKKSSVQAFTVKKETDKAVLLECNYTQVWFRSKSSFVWN